MDKSEFAESIKEGELDQFLVNNALDDEFDLDNFANNVGGGVNLNNDDSNEQREREEEGFDNRPGSPPSLEQK